jgi:hypothetical protein
MQSQPSVCVTPPGKSASRFRIRSSSARAEPVSVVPVPRRTAGVGAGSGGSALCPFARIGTVSIDSDCLNRTLGVRFSFSSRASIRRETSRLRSAPCIRSTSVTRRSGASGLTSSSPSPARASSFSRGEAPRSASPFGNSTRTCSPFLRIRQFQAFASVVRTSARASRVFPPAPRPCSQGDSPGSGFSALATGVRLGHCQCTGQL